MKIEKLLFSTRFRELAFNALEPLLVLKNAGLREILLYYVIPRDEVGFVPFGGYLKDEEERLHEEARIRFEDWQKAIRSQGIDSRIIIEVGDPVPNILHLAEREKVNLVVIGKKKKVGSETSFLGAHRTLQIITRCKVPTLVSKYMVEFEWGGESVTRINKDIFKRPLLATDWSEPSERALEILLTLPGIVEKASVVHVIGVRATDGVHKSELHQLEEESKRRLDDHCKRLQGVGIPAESHLGAGKSHQEIIRISRALDASMIMVGTTGKDRVKELFLGSNSHKIAELSELPTLLVPGQ